MLKINSVTLKWSNIMANRRISLTESDYQLIANTSISGQVIAETLGISPTTVFRKRKALGIEVRPGVKPGTKLLNRETKFKKICAEDKCNNAYYTVPSADQMFCSRSCAARYQWLTNNPSKPGPRPWRKKDGVSEYTRYKRSAHNKSHEVYTQHIDIINPNRHPRTLCGVAGGWQLDHIKSVRECFNEGISVEECSKLDNLQMLPWKNNLLKG